jgi:hypothetical protein
LQLKRKNQERIGYASRGTGPTATHSDLEENLALIEPVTEIPHDEEYGEALRDGPQPAEKNIVPSERPHDAVEHLGEEDIHTIDEN